MDTHNKLQSQRPQQIKRLFAATISALIVLDIISFYWVEGVSNEDASLISSHIGLLHIVFTVLALIYVYRKINQQLIFCALHDLNTNIFNRHAFHHLLTAEVARSQRYHRPLSLIVFDLDNFKQVNDTFNHAVGDKVLTVISEKMHSLIRHSDYLCRIGGEEFAIIVPETQSKDALVLAEKIRRTIEHADFKPVSHVTVSAGISELTPNMTFDDLLASACDALKSAKHNGRNQVINKTPAIPSET